MLAFFGWAAAFALTAAVAGFVGLVVGVALAEVNPRAQREVLHGNERYEQ